MLKIWLYIQTKVFLDRTKIRSDRANPFPNPASSYCGSSASWTYACPLQGALRVLGEQAQRLTWLDAKETGILQYRERHLQSPSFRGLGASVFFDPVS